MCKWSFNRVAFILFLFVSASTATANPISDAAKSALYTDIEFNGSTSIIVEFKSARFVKSLSGSAKKSAVKSMHQNFVGSLSASTAKNVSSSFSYVPGVVLSVDQPQLQEVLTNPNVKRVYQNKARRISLQESLGVVFPGTAKEKFSGKGQAVAIIDTGVDRSHRFFSSDAGSRVVSEACYSGGGLSGFREVSVLCPSRSREQTGVGAGKDCTSFNFPGCDHGTHVAGIAAGNDGVAKDASIIAIQVFTGIRDVFRANVCGSGVGRNCVVAFDSDIIKGLERVYALRNTYSIASVNMSLAGGRFAGSCDTENRIMTNIIEQLKSAGIATVISSGNNGFSSSVSFPACISSAVAVGATSDFTGTVFDRAVNKDERVFYSNHSKTIDLFAPGTLIRSSIPGERFANFNGTSMAAPHVAAAFAVIKAGNNALTVETIEDTLKSVGKSVSHSGVSRQRIDITSALKRLRLLNSGLSAPTLLLLLDDT